LLSAGRQTLLEHGDLLKERVQAAGSEAIAA
jgi:hypothetical protein